MKQFFFGNQASMLCTLCALLGILFAFALPPLDGYAYHEVFPHMVYWLVLPVFGFIGLYQEHRRCQRSSQ